MTRAYAPADVVPEAVSKRTKPALSLALLTLLALLSAVSISLQSPPEALPKGAPPESFSAGRALTHLENIARRPHSLGTAEHAAVRDYLVSSLNSLGLGAEVQTATMTGDDGGSPYVAATVNNVIGRLRGTGGGGPSLLLTGHYDSVPSSPGASDDGAAVAALLETARALKAAPPLRNDVVFLFTDGEEAGLLGARAFVGGHPAAKGVGLVLNFEARGSGGPVHMFETSEGNGRLIREFAAAAPNPLANSLSVEIYRRLPNDTDLTVYRRAGLPGLNFAYIEGLSRYHTAADSVEHLDERSLQHHGSYALALARHFGDLDLERRVDGDAVYFNPVGTLFVHYPQWLSVPLAVLAALLFAWVVVRGLRRGSLSRGGLVRGAVAMLLCGVVSSLAAEAAWSIVRALHKDYRSVPWGDVDRLGLYTLGLLFLAAAAAAAVWAWFRRRAAAEDLSVGSLGWWTLLALLTSIAVPGASYLFTWPLLFALAAHAFLFSAAGERRTRALVVLAACAVPGVLLLSPLIEQTLVALTLSAAGAVVVLEVLLLGLLLPQFEALPDGGRRWLLPGVCALAALGLLTAGLLTSRLAGGQPRMNNAFYALDADTGRAVWGSSDREVDEWTAQFFAPAAEKSPLPEFFPLARGTFLKADAQALALQAPGVVVLEDGTERGMRTLKLRVTSTRAAAVVSFYADPGSEVIAAAVNDTPLKLEQAEEGPPSERPWALSYYGFPAEGATLTLVLRVGRPLRLRVDDRTYGLPQMPGKAISPRPENVFPPPFNDITLVSKSYTL